MKRREIILFMTVGTGSNVDSKEDGFKQLAKKLFSTINKIYPDHVIFFASEESRQTIPYIEEMFKKDHDEFVLDEDYEIVSIEAIDDFNACFETFEWKIWDYDFENKDKYKIIMDYTSGTKTMSAAMACCGLFYSKDLISVGGDRSTGEVSPGTELINYQNPYKIYDKFLILRTRHDFNANRFMSCIDTLNNVIDDVHIDVDSFLSLCKAYNSWDNMDFESAFEHMKNVNIKQFGFFEIKNDLKNNIGALGKIVNSRSSNLKNCYILASLINNSIRKAEDHSYADAIARIYRAFELIGQIRLESYSIDTSDVDLSVLSQNNVCEEFIAELEKQRFNGKIKTGLILDYLILNELGDDLGKHFMENEKKIINLTQKRNSSILAHGLESRTEKDFDAFLDVVVDMAKKLDKNMDKFLKETKFAKFELKVEINKL